MNENTSQGVISHSNDSSRRTDYLYRISLKCLIRNDKGEILVVKEDGRDWWDLPGGGMDHGEDFKAALAREMKEEVNLEGDFNYRIIHVDEPTFLNSLSIWQVRLVFEAEPENMHFEPGADGDECTFVDPNVFNNSEKISEQRLFAYTKYL